jgi:hypothetical protein
MVYTLYCQVLLSVVIALTALLEGHHPPGLCPGGTPRPHG